MTAVFDAGLQPERTLLAWRRTCLAFGLASAVMARFSVELFGPWAVFVGLAGVGLAGGAYVAVAHRYRRAHDSLIATGELADAAAPLLLVWLAALLVGAACTAFTVIRMLA